MGATTACLKELVMERVFRQFLQFLQFLTLSGLLFSFLQGEKAGLPRNQTILLAEIGIRFSRDCGQSHSLSVQVNTGDAELSGSHRCSG